MDTKSITDETGYQQKALRKAILASAATILFLFTITLAAKPGSYPVVDTGQTSTYDNSSEITPPAPGGDFYGQDAQIAGNQPSYQDNGDGTITDLVTGLMWSKSPDLNGDGVIDVYDKLTYDEALAGAATFDLAGYNDWRLPTIKELYSLIDFRGTDPGGDYYDLEGLVPFINTTYFNFGYGDTSAGERIIDAQFATTTKYVSTTMNGAETMFGVNFADGRIKGYPSEYGKTFYVYYVRGNEEYGQNDLVDNGDGTITDGATSLMWSQSDSGSGMDWKEALAWVQEKNTENYLGHNDWRLPNAKELESIVDYSRSPDTTGSAAIDPMFEATEITNEGGNFDYPWYWTGTTHAMKDGHGIAGIYVTFGRALGWMGDPCLNLLDVHGAGAQRSDPKNGTPLNYYLGTDCSGNPVYGRGPQGDVVRIDNFVRLVRDESLSASFTLSTDEPTAGADVTFTASAYNGTAPYSYDWNVDGTSVSGQEFTQSFDEGTYMVTLTVTDSESNQAQSTQVVTVLPAVSITSAKKKHHPFKIKLFGISFKEGCTVTISGTEVSNVICKSSNRINLKGCKKLCPKGETVSIIVINPDGASSEPFSFTR